MKRIKVAAVGEIGPGTMKGVRVDGGVVLVANIGGVLYGMQGICSHAGGHLWEGKLMDNVVKCPRHGSEYDVRTGKVIKGPWVPFGKAHDLATYPLVVEGSDVFVDLPE